MKSLMFGIIKQTDNYSLKTDKRFYSYNTLTANLGFHNPLFLKQYLILLITNSSLRLHSFTLHQRNIAIYYFLFQSFLAHSVKRPCYRPIFNAI